jgi:AmmeMemoRadiSam system protein A
MTLIKLSRYVLARFVRDGIEEYGAGELAQFAITDGLRQNAGVVVTRDKDGELRGCTGYVTGRGMLYESVIEMTMQAAAHDPRFSPVEQEELSDIEIEISVMTPLRTIASPDEVVVGRDGVYLVNGARSGVFLPQVPIEWNWDRTTFLEELGRKAGLSPNAYRDKNTELYVFSAQVFGEK